MLNFSPLDYVRQKLVAIIPPGGFCRMLMFCLFTGCLLMANSTLAEPTKNLKRLQTKWPIVYPKFFKVAFRLGLQRVGLVEPGTIGFAPNAGLAYEQVWMSTGIYGIGYDLSFLPASSFFKGAKMHRISLHSGFVIPLDNYEKKHLVICFRPGLGWLRSQIGKGMVVGYGLGLQYEVALNADYILAPELFYQRFSAFGSGGYRLMRLGFGLRLSFGK